MSTTITLDAKSEKRLEKLVAATGKSKDFYLKEILKEGLEDVEYSYLPDEPNMKKSPVKSVRAKSIKPAAPKKPKLSEDEVSDIIQQANAAWKAGDRKRYRELGKQLPIPPLLADNFKRNFGLAVLLDGGFDLSEAVEEFGEEWLDE